MKTNTALITRRCVISGRVAHQLRLNVDLAGGEFGRFSWRVTPTSSSGSSEPPCASKHLGTLIMSGTLHVGHPARIISLPNASAASALMWCRINDLDGFFFRFTCLIACCQRLSSTVTVADASSIHLSFHLDTRLFLSCKACWSPPLPFTPHPADTLDRSVLLLMCA